MAKQKQIFVERAFVPRNFVAGRLSDAEFRPCKVENKRHKANALRGAKHKGRTTW